MMLIAFWKRALHINHMYNAYIIEEELHAVIIATDSYTYNIHVTFIIDQELYAVYHYK